MAQAKKAAKKKKSAKSAQVMKNAKLKSRSAALKSAVKKAAGRLAKKIVTKAETIVSGFGESQAKSLVGTSVPKIKVPMTGGGEASLGEFTGKRIVLYFYPKDSTPGCTLEGYDFKRLKNDFDSENAIILGVSKDSLKSHESFKLKCGFPFELLVDQEEKLSRAFDVIQMKSLYGRRYLGIERSTFVIDEKGKVAHEWRKVKVNGHAEEVLEFLRKLS
jgi:peroxiredoxin Q/BCP